MIMDRKDIKDKIIKIVLIIIIILLLVHNCSLLKKKGKERVPSGNVNIIEITCEDNNICDKDNDTGNKDNNDKKNTDNTERNNAGRTNTGSINRAGNDKNNNEDSNSNTGSSSSGSTDTSSEVPEEEEEDDGLFKVRDSDIVWKDTTDLKIFENSMYNFESNIIAPESSNTYEFVVKNSTSYNLKYNISFIETNPYHINMKYKLKKNNTYLVDHYVYFNELDIDEQLIDAKKNDTFYLEWKWFSADNDNEIGANKASYELLIDVRAESI